MYETLICPPSHPTSQDNPKDFSAHRIAIYCFCNVESGTWGPSTTSTLRTRAKQRPLKKHHTNTSKLLFLLCVLGSFALILLDPIGGSWIPSEQILSRHRIAGHIDGSGSCYEVACHSHADKIINAARLDRRYQQNWYCSCQGGNPATQVNISVTDKLRGI